MNFIKFESAQKLRGGFYTEKAIASFLVRWVRECKPKSLLEPSCGDGAFLEEVQRQRFKSLQLITACEIDEEESRRAGSRTALPVRMITSDFLRWYLLHARDREVFDAVIGNPPFIRYQYLPEEQKVLAEKIFSQLSLPFTKHTNAWVPFVLASVQLLRPGGRIAMVIPSEVFHIPHAQSVRQFLADQCSRVLLIDPEEILFSDTLQGTVLLLAEKKARRTQRTEGVAVVPMNDRAFLALSPEDVFQNASYTNGATIQGKWMPVFLSRDERTLLKGLAAHPGIHRFSDVASVDVGIVTGANQFFLVPDSTLDEYDLHPWAHPMFGRSDHVQGLIYAKQDHDRNRAAGIPANFLWFQEDAIDGFSTRARKYIDLGVTQDLHTRFKCRTRKPWYRVPSVHSTPIAMLKRAHHYPRLVLNDMGAFTTDTAYRIRPIGVKPESLVFSFINSLTCLTAELEGRHYGGGVLELVPTEIERLLVPLIKSSRTQLRDADQRFRQCESESEYLRSRDKIVLEGHGLSANEQAMLHAAWVRLRDRRHRTTPTANASLTSIPKSLCAN